MKTKTLILALLSLCLFGCSETDQTTSSQKKILKEVVSELISQKDFQNQLNTLHNTQLERGINNGNGAFVIDNPGGLIFGYLYDGHIIFAFAEEGPGTITFLPNGNARFSVNSKSPVCLVFDMESFEAVYTNDCDVVKQGRVFSNLTSSYDMFETPFGTFYFPNEPQSGSVYKVTASVTDGEAVFDDDFNLVDCLNETVRKTVTIIDIAPAGNGNGTTEVNIQ